MADASSDPQDGDPDALDGESGPGSLVHRKVLEVADSNPEAPVESVAESVDGASVTFVERVLEEYGDPGADDRSTPRAGTDEDESADGRDSETEPVQEPTELTETQYETLRAVADDPTATQKEIAESLGVSRAAVSKRLSDVPGFEWTTRREFVERLFDEGQPGATLGDQETSLDGLRARVDDLEQRLDEQQTAGLRAELDTALASKVVHACLAADYVSPGEERQLIRALLSDRDQ